MLYVIVQRWYDSLMTIGKSILSHVHVLGDCWFLTMVGTNYPQDE